MKLPSAGLATIEASLNRLISGDSATLEICQELADKSIGLRFEDVGLELHFLLHGDGVQVHHGELADADALLSMAAVRMASRILQKGAEPRALMSEMDVRGDAELAERFVQLLRQLDFDPEDILAEHFGDAIAHRMGEFGRSLLRLAKDAGLGMRADVERGLTSAQGPAVEAAAAEAWMEQVQNFDDAVSRAEARLKRIESMRFAADSSEESQ